MNLTNIVSLSSLEDNLIDAKDKVTVVLFWNNYCQQCKMLKQKIQSVANDDRKVSEKMNLLYIDSDLKENSEIISKLNIVNVPTVLIYINGEVVDRLSSSAAVEYTVKKIKEFTAKV